jgi:acyl-CoA synthetase (NDP forming)/GNAT superfamily N-acetyltransferase
MAVPAVDVALRDGSTLRVRPAEPADHDAIRDFLAALSEESRWLRFFSTGVDFERAAQAALSPIVLSLLALAGDRVVGHGLYAREAPGRAEVAFAIADDWQSHGIATILLAHLADAAAAEGIDTFTATVLPGNHRMIGVFRDSGFPVQVGAGAAEIELAFPTSLTPEGRRRFEERERIAAAAAVAHVLRPASVAVVGASRRRGTVGGELLHNLVTGGFNGPLYAVNPHVTEIDGVRCFPSVADLPEPVELAVIMVPAVHVIATARACGELGVRGLVIVSAGFAEVGAEGIARQRELMAVCRAAGMRVVGPNCLGIINTDAVVHLNASLAPLPPLAGRAGFFAQSGALGVAVLGEAARRGIGVSTFVSAGSRADVSGNDLLQYWETDERTQVVLMYLESFGNPRKFARLARRLGRTKPIVAVNSGAGTVVPGLESTSAHLPDEGVRALFERSGVIRVDTVGDLFDVALLLTSQPLPDGPRVAVVGNSTALAVLVRNACAAEGLSLGCVEDVGVDAAPEAFEQALQKVLARDDVDAVVVVFVPPLQPASGEDVALALRRVAALASKPLLSTFLGFEGVPGALAAHGESSPAPGSVPSYASPERAVRALARVVRYAAWRKRPRSTVPELAINVPAVRSLVDDVLADSADARALRPDEIARLLGAIGLKLSAEVPPDSVEVVIGARDDPSFGAIAWFGIGGVATELLGDRAYASVPLTSADAEDLVNAPRAAPLLTGYGGAPPMDLLALHDVLLRVSALADAVPEIAECTLRALATPVGAQVASATARVAPASARADTGPRRMRGF